MASSKAQVPFPRRSLTLRAGLYVAQALAGFLLAAPAEAQDPDDLEQLIFEVAPIPAADSVAVGPGGGGNGETGVAGAESAPTGNGGASAGGAMVPAPASLQADITAYRARIDDTRANASPYSAELREQYDALGTLLQQSGDHEEAIKAFESAMHIDRVNTGLYTLDQIPVVEKMIASHEALGHDTDVDDLHGYLFYIQQKSYADGDPRLLAAQEAWADWNVTSYLKERARDGASFRFDTGDGVRNNIDYVAVQDPRDGTFVYVPRAQLLTELNPLAGRSSFDPTFMQTYGVDAERIIDDRLRTARKYYEDIVEVTAPDEDSAEAVPASDADPEDAYRVERKLANVAFAIKDQFARIDTVEALGSLYTRSPQNFRAPLAVTRGYQRNRDMLEASAQKLEQDPSATALQKAQAWIDFGDWHVAYDYAQRGEDAYRKAWELLRASGMDEAAIEQVFMPDLLVPAPGFATHRYSREIYGIDPAARLDYKGHMDLTLNVNRYGDVSGVRILSAVPEVSQGMRSELLDYLRSQKMRPAIVNGEVVKRDDVMLRYYYSYLDVTENR